MANSLGHNLQFQVKKLSIVTKLGELDVTSLFQELNIFDSILTPCINGNIIIVDSSGISSKLSFDGSEVLIVYMTKRDDVAAFKKAFRIYKQTDRKNINETSEVYILHFVSEEFILSQQLKVTKTYKMIYSDVVTDILKTHLGVTNTMVSSIERSVGIRDVVIPNKSPIDAIDFCAKRAINTTKSPTFLFFENKLGYNFITTSKLISQNAVYNLTYEPKNLSDDIGASSEVLGIRAFEVLNNHDLNKNIKSGLYAGTFIGVDLRNRVITKKEVNYNELSKINEKANRTPDIGVVYNKAGKRNIDMYGSRVTVFASGLYGGKSEYVRENYPEIVNTDDDTYNYVLQREASFRNLLQKRLKMVLPGNFDLTSGLNVNVNIPIRGVKIGSDSIDKVVSGKYMIIASRHIIRYDRHETIIEVATDSTNEDRVIISTGQELATLQQYE